ncbi:U2-aranetoxin-Av1a [Araneus ventricosus]|uniref:U2-aranetoxin-Av1a n=1 Tax=Araneus ventricosus TaxID=182803 RepID=A0A4Y2DGV7_ARAVE|nr:U2-aranetoxin-Av1a [Araneus ventricosus]
MPYKSMEIRQIDCGGWNSAWTEIGAKTLVFKVSLQREPERGTGKAVADVEALACDPAQCMRSCPFNPFLYQYGGICKNGQCVCVKPS